MFYLLGCNSESDFWSGLTKDSNLQQEFVFQLKQNGLSEVAVLATCHRWECYWYDEGNTSVEIVRTLIKKNLFTDVEFSTEILYFKAGPSVINHLFRVSAGLDSLIIGEHEILGQVRDCLAEASKLRIIGPILAALFREAVSIGKKVRNQTAIGRGKATYASLIVDLIEKNNRIQPGTEVLIIGTGKLAKSIGILLVKKGMRPYFAAGRDLQKAITLAQDLKGDWLTCEQLPEMLPKFSLVIGASKANRYLIGSEDLRFINRQQLIIDLSVPGVICPEVNEYKNVEFIGMNVIECIIHDNLQQRLAETEAAELLVARAVEEMVVSLRQRQRQEQIDIAQDKLYQQGQSALNKLLAQINDDGLKQNIMSEWNTQLKKLIYLALSADKVEKLKTSFSGENNYFPIILSLVDKRIIVVGGGNVASRKITKLLEAGGRITVIAPELNPELLEFVKTQRIQWQNDCFSPESLRGFDLVIAATDSQTVNLAVVAAAHIEKILVNSVDDAMHSDFLFPAIIRRGDLLIAVSTSGKRPALSRKIRQELELLFGQEYSELLNDKDSDSL